MKILSLLALSALISGGTVRAFPAGVPPAAENAAGLPATFVSATDLLFADGMSDPRGGVYRKITVKSKSFWSPDCVVATHGWVLSVMEESGKKRAVAWNGLTYDVVTDVGPADLNADIAALVKARSAEPKSEPTRLQRIFAPDKGFVTDWHPLELTAACLLDRIGYAGLAKRCCSAAQSDATEYVDSESHPRWDPFRKLADYWVGAIYDRAVQEHDHADDRRAADDAEFIARVSLRIEDQSVSRGSGVLRYSRLAQGAVSQFNFPGQFNFLDSAAVILTDSKRRLATPRSALDIAALRLSHVKAADRIPWLIQHLDDVRCFEDSNPGTLRFDYDPVVEALVKEGDAAVDPLLDAMERDNRLTRVARFGRRSDRSSPVSVSYAAFFCLTRILQTWDFGGTGNATVADIRAYWKVNRRLPIADRWYRTLRDDSAGSDRWLEAAKNIVAVVGSNDDASWRKTTHPNCGSALPAMQGESLRVRSNPSISVLLARRTAMLARAKTSSSDSQIGADNTQFREGITLALDLAAWDLKASRPILKRLARRSLACLGKDPTAGFGYPVGEMTVARMHAGDPEAIADYIAYMHQFLKAKFATPDSELFLPLCEYPDNPVFAREAKRLFEDANSRFNTVSKPFVSSGESQSDLDELISTSLLCVPAFRRQVVRELGDHRLAGKGLVGEELNLSWTRGGSGEMGSSEQPSDPYNLPPGTAFTFRLCDLYAWEVHSVCASVSQASKSPAAPRLELYWPEPQRDVAILQMRNYLEHCGSHFKPADFR